MNDHRVPLSVEDVLVLAASLEFPLDPARAPLIAGVLHHIRTVIARLDELPLGTDCPPAASYTVTKEIS